VGFPLGFEPKPRSPLEVAPSSIRHNIQKWWGHVESNHLSRWATVLQTIWLPSALVTPKLVFLRGIAPRFSDRESDVLAAALQEDEVVPVGF
jgi:hypothetical protein